MKLPLALGAAFLGVLSVSADTNLVNSKSWRVDGAVDVGPNPRDINVVVDGLPAGPFSELKIFFNFGRTNLQQVFNLKGEGAIQLLVPPPVVTGGVFRLTSYRDCDQGLVGPMRITDLEFKTPKGSNAVMLVKGKLSNFDSLVATDLKMRLNPPETNMIVADIGYKLTATRDICVDHTLDDEQDEFRIAQVEANFVSPATNQVTRLRYLRNKDKLCDGLGDCVKIKEVFCADLDGVAGYFLRKPRSLGDGSVVLLHTNAVPRNTPSLGINFVSPSHGRVKPQVFFVPSTEPADMNVTLWGNWVDTRAAYLAGKTVTRVRVLLGARDPINPGCDTIQPPAP